MFTLVEVIRKVKAFLGRIFLSGKMVPLSTVPEPKIMELPKYPWPYYILLLSLYSDYLLSWFDPLTLLNILDKNVTCYLTKYIRLKLELLLWKLKPRSHSLIRYNENMMEKTDIHSF